MASSPSDTPEVSPASPLSGADAAGTPRAVDEVPTHILMVDDHPANLLALEGILAPLGQVLVRATSGAEALKAVLQHDFALILMDVQMPGMDGFQTAKLIKDRERSRSIPIIFLTALSRDAANVFKGYKHGAVDYLLKPFDAEILRAKVQVFVELYHKTEKLKRQEQLLRDKELEAVERKADLRFQTLTESIPQGIWALHGDGMAYYANRRAQALAGNSSDGFLSAVVGESRERIDSEFKVARAAGKAFEREALLKSASTGFERWHIIRAVPECDEAGKPCGFFVTADDIDDLKRAEHELKLASEAKDLFLAAASHELRTPLQAAKGHTHLAMKKLGDSAEQAGLKKSVVTIGRQIDRMAKLVEDLLDISRLQAGRLQLDVEKFDIVPMLRDTVDRMQGMSAEHQLSAELPESLQIVADKSRLDQVITNLISNAIRYSPRGGAVKVFATTEAGELRLSVRDNGIGIPPDKQAVIFERFGQAHGARYGGLGLGLTITHGIVAQHGGRIWVESSGVPGEGSVFYVALPLTDADKVEVGPEAHAARPAQAELPH